jgi:hypothetical protein
MNRTRHQIKAAKARKDWELLQKKQREEKESNERSHLKQLKNQLMEESLRDSA